MFIIPAVLPPATSRCGVPKQTENDKGPNPNPPTLPTPHRPIPPPAEIKSLLEF